MALLRRSNRTTPSRYRPDIESLEARRLLAFIGETIPTPTLIEPAIGIQQRFHFGSETYDMIWEPVGNELQHAHDEHDKHDEHDEFEHEIDLAADLAEGELPILHSLPEAQTKVYLDFDGNFESSWGGHQNVVTPPYDVNGNPDVLDSEEQSRIVEIWRRVAEDFSPFNIDVTTDDPSDAETSLGEIDSSNNRVRTFYFRRNFDISNENDIQDLQVQLLRDDGAAVYLNGIEIIRDNLAADAEFDDFATAGASGSDERTYHRFHVDEELLLPGRNVIAVEVHQRSDSSSDVSFDMRLVGTVDGTRDSSIIEDHSEWRYLDDGSNQGTAWQAATFDDSSWKIGIGEFGYGDVVATTHVAIGGSSNDWFGGGAGGVAFVNGYSESGRTVAFVFPRSIDNNAKSVAEASSHEAGHTFGLSHQSVYDEETGERITEYNSGSGEWAPIMGVSYDRSLSTWHRGPTSSVNSRQDDLNIIGRSANGFGFRTDAHGNTISRAAALSDFQDADGFVTVEGVLERNSDRDAFTFTLDESQSGVAFAVQGVGIGQNLNAVLELRDAENELLISNDPETSLDASIETKLAPGTYTVIVQSNGEYGRIGQYVLRGHIDESSAIVRDFSRPAPYGIPAYSRSIRGAIDFADDSDSYVIAGQPGQSLTAVIRPVDPAAMISVQSSVIGKPIVSSRSGEAVRIPASLLTDDHQTFEITSSVTTDYWIDFGINHEVEFNADQARGSSDSQPVNIDGSRSSNAAHFAVSGRSGDGSDTHTALVSRGATWSFLDDGSNQRTAWRQPDFDDSEWSEGTGHFGYGDGDETVLLRERSTSGNRIRTFYFRHAFPIDDVAAIDNLTLNLLRDDGAAVYLNGTEVRRDNLSANAGYRTLASRADDEDIFTGSQVATDLLVEGENVLAVELHQTSDSSSDVSFEFELIANSFPTTSEVDVYEFTLTEALIGQSFDIALFSDIDFSGQTLELFNPDGQRVARAVAVDGEASLAMYDTTLNLPGVYRVRLDSQTHGDYTIAITSNVWPEYKLGLNGLPIVSFDQPSIGFLSETNLDDSFELVVANPAELTFSIDIPTTADSSVNNDLRTSLLVFSEGGSVVTASNDAQHTTSLTAGTYRVDVLQLSGAGDYSLIVSTDDLPPTGDLNSDGVVDTLDIDHLCSAIRNSDILLDQNGDGQVNTEDLATFVFTTLHSTYGDVNLDGTFNSGDLVLIFQANEYEDAVENNSTWSEGDWNCDGDADTNDLVIAFQTGDYSEAAVSILSTAGPSIINPAINVSTRLLELESTSKSSSIRDKNNLVRRRLHAFAAGNAPKPISPETIGVVEAVFAETTSKPLNVNKRNPVSTDGTFEFI